MGGTDVIVDIGIEREFVEVGGVTDGEVEAFIPDWVKITFFDCGTECLTIEVELNIWTG